VREGEKKKIHDDTWALEAALGPHDGESAQIFVETVALALGCISLESNSVLSSSALSATQCDT
jgi:hypothetical protein